MHKQFRRIERILWKMEFKAQCPFLYNEILTQYIPALQSQVCYP
jgi:hypothetical protein